MKSKVDENLPVEFAALLRQAGHEADTVYDENLAGTEDSILLHHCRQQVRLLITLDLDFANVQAYPPESQVGIVVLRSKAQDKLTLLTLLRRFLLLLRDVSPEKQLWIVEQDRVRYRS